MYPDKLILLYVSGEEWELMGRFRCVIPGAETITVPAGFTTDLASIPRVFRSVVPVVGKQNAPAVIHDYCYATRWKTRKASDLLFLDGMKYCGVGLFRRWGMYTAVRVGGWVAWRKTST